MSSAPALVGRDDPPPDPGGAGLDRLLDRRLCAAHACLDDQALLAAREAIGSSCRRWLGLRGAAAFVVFVVWHGSTTCAAS